MSIEEVVAGNPITAEGQNKVVDGLNRARAPVGEDSSVSVDNSTASTAIKVRKGLEGDKTSVTIRVHNTGSKIGKGRPIVVEDTVFKKEKLHGGGIILRGAAPEKDEDSEGKPYLITAEPIGESRTGIAHASGVFLARVVGNTDDGNKVKLAYNDDVDQYFSGSSGIDALVIGEEGEGTLIWCESGTVSTKRYGLIIWPTGGGGGTGFRIPRHTTFPPLPAAGEDMQLIELDRKLWYGSPDDSRWRVCGMFTGLTGQPGSGV